MKNILAILAIVLLGISCEEKMVVIPVFDVIETGKIMLVEELTGVRCPNCPAGTARLKSISESLPGNVIIVGVHGVDLAKPLDESKYDFRNQDAADLEQYLKPFLGKPAAYFNRIKYEDLGGDFGNPFQGQWEPNVRAELEKPQTINIELSKTYDPVTRQLDLNVSAIPLVDIEGSEFKVTVMILENEIIDAQDNVNVIEEEYLHEHVLMDIVSAFNGDFFASELNENEVVNKTYTYTLPDNQEGLWVEEHIEVVAFIALTEGESEEVLQAVKGKLLD